MSGWLDSSNNANCFKQTYVQGFVDVSGGSIITRGTGGGLVIGGDSSLNGTVYLGNSIFVQSDGMVAPGTADNGATSYNVDVSGNADNGATSYDISGNADNGAEVLSVSFPTDASWSHTGYLPGGFERPALNDDGTILATGAAYGDSFIYKYRTVSQETWDGLDVGDTMGDTDGPLPDKKYWVKMNGGILSTGANRISGDGTVVMVANNSSNTTVKFYSYNDISWSLTNQFSNSSGGQIALNKDGNVGVSHSNQYVTTNYFKHHYNLFFRSNGAWTKVDFSPVYPTNSSYVLSKRVAKDSYGNYYMGIATNINSVRALSVGWINNDTITLIDSKDEIYRPDQFAHKLNNLEITSDGKYLVASHKRYDNNNAGSNYVSVFHNTSTTSTPEYYRYAQFAVIDVNASKEVKLEVNKDASVIITHSTDNKLATYQRTGTTYNRVSRVLNTPSSFEIASNNDGTIIAVRNDDPTDGYGYVYELDNTKTYSDVIGGYYDVSVFGGYLNDGLTSAALYVNGDTDLSGGLTVSGDVSFNAGNLFVAGDLSLNGNLYINSYAANSIGADAINSTVDINFANKLSVSTADISLNATTLQVATDFNSNNTLTTLATNLKVPANIAIVDGSNGTVYGSYLTLTDKDATAYYNVGKSASGIFNIVDQANAGVYLASGGTSFTGTSDARLKTHIASLESATDKIMALNPCTYQWKSDDPNTKPHVGFIAQEVEQLLPELVHPIDHPAGPDYKGVNTTDMIPYLVQTIQEQTQRITRLQEKLAAIKNQQ